MIHKVQKNISFSKRKFRSLHCGIFLVPHSLHPNGIRYVFELPLDLFASIGENVNRLDKGVGHIVWQVGLRFKVLCSPVKLAFFWDIEQFKLYSTVSIVVGIEVN